MIGLVVIVLTAILVGVLAKTHPSRGVSLKPFALASHRIGNLHGRFVEVTVYGEVRRELGSTLSAKWQGE